MMRKLILFDIDGTLVLTGGAGIRAMNRACEELVGHPHALEGIPVAGRTDQIILADVVARAGHSLDDGLPDQLRERYIANLSEEIEKPGRTQAFESLGARGGLKAVMPGIRELLDRLERRDDVFLALLTGNFEAGCGATSAAARSATMPPIGMRWCRLPWRVRGNAGSRTPSHRNRFSWSAIRRMTSPARARWAPRQSESPPAASRSSSFARAAPTSCSRRSPIPVSS
jgi:hypothetical protein